MITPINIQFTKPNTNELYEDWIKRVISEINRVVVEINKEIERRE